MTDITTKATDSVVNSTPKKKRGRPSKKELTAAKKVLGRPKETTGRIAELKARLLATSGDKVLNEIIRKALDPEDKDQIAALKMCIDRILPVSLFEKSAGRSNAITINISTGDNTVVAGETIDAEDATFVAGGENENEEER
jgi:hypothetical protein